jgi:hypothetical protein
MRLWPLPVVQPWAEDWYGEFRKRPEPGQEKGARIPGLDGPWSIAAGEFFAVVAVVGGVDVG